MYCYIIFKNSNGNYSPYCLGVYDAFSKAEKALFKYLKSKELVFEEKIIVDKDVIEYSYYYKTYGLCYYNSFFIQREEIK